MYTLIDFYTTWCPPCKAMAPHIDQIASEYSGKIKVVKINIDNEPAWGKKYNINTVPTLILFRDNQPIKRRVGGGSKMDIYNFIKDIL